MCRNQTFHAGPALHGWIRVLGASAVQISLKGVGLCEVDFLANVVILPISETFIFYVVSRDLNQLVVMWQILVRLILTFLLSHIWAHMNRPRSSLGAANDGRSSLPRFLIVAAVVEHVLFAVFVKVGSLPFNSMSSAKSVVAIVVLALVVDSLMILRQDSLSLERPLRLGTGAEDLSEFINVFLIFKLCCRFPLKIIFNFLWFRIQFKFKGGNARLVILSRITHFGSLS